MEPKLVNLEEYVLSGAGNAGESYSHRTNQNIMLKLYPQGQDDNAFKEHSIALKVYESGIPTPEPVDVVKTADGRIGVLFRRIPNKISFARAVANDPSKVNEYAERFAVMCQKLHTTHVDTNEFPCVKDFYIPAIENHSFLTTSQKDKIIRFIADTPDVDTALQGDLHLGNVITDGQKDWFIDLGEFAYGSPLFDLGSALCMKNLPEEACQHTFHTSSENITRFWNSFIKAYATPGTNIGEFEEQISPYAGIRCLYFHNTEFILPIVNILMKSVI